MLILTWTRFHVDYSTPSLSLWIFVRSPSVESLFSVTLLPGHGAGGGVDGRGGVGVGAGGVRQLGAAELSQPEPGLPVWGCSRGRPRGTRVFRQRHLIFSGGAAATNATPPPAPPASARLANSKRELLQPAPASGARFPGAILLNAQPPAPPGSQRSGVLQYAILGNFKTVPNAALAAAAAAAAAAARAPRRLPDALLFVYPPPPPSPNPPITAPKQPLNTP